MKQSNQPIYTGGALKWKIIFHTFFGVVLVVGGAAAILAVLIPILANEREEWSSVQIAGVLAAVTAVGGFFIAIGYQDLRGAQAERRARTRGTKTISGLGTREEYGTYDGACHRLHVQSSTEDGVLKLVFEIEKDVYDKLSDKPINLTITYFDVTEGGWTAPSYAHAETIFRTS